MNIRIREACTSEVLSGCGLRKKINFNSQIADSVFSTDEGDGSKHFWNCEFGCSPGRGGEAANGHKTRRTIIPSAFPTDASESELTPGLLVHPGSGWCRLPRIGVTPH